MEEMNTSGVTVVKSDAPSDYQIAPRTEPSTTRSIPQSITSQLVVASSPPYTAAGVTPVTEKKKRGRPRKHGQDQSTVVRLYLQNPSQPN
ncbi:putative AT-hook motif nuclear-localized protein [Helianthus anomalus]